MKDKELPNIFGLDESDKELSLDEIIAADANDDAAEDKLINSARRNSKAKKVSLIAGTTALAAAVTAGFLFFTPFGGDLNFNKNSNLAPIASDASPSPGPTDPEFMSGGDVGNKEKFAHEDNTRYPIKLADWEKTRYSDQKSEDLRSQILKATSGTEVSKAGNFLPSESSGYTSDLTKSSLPDGTLNPMFSFWTSENFNAETQQYIKRLINPTFGGWDAYQYSSYPGDKYFDTRVVADMFTAKWRTDNLDKPYSSYIPVYADWAGNDYGMADKLLDSGSRWFGTVTASNTSFKYSSEELQYSADVTAEITFTAWAKDQTKLEKKGTLTLHLVPNVNNGNGSGHKVLIESASLKVDG